MQIFLCQNFSIQNREAIENGIIKTMFALQESIKYTPKFERGFR